MTPHKPHYTGGKTIYLPYFLWAGWVEIQSHRQRSNRPGLCVQFGLFTAWWFFCLMIPSIDDLQMADSNSTPTGWGPSKVAWQRSAIRLLLMILPQKHLVIGNCIFENHLICRRGSSHLKCFWARAIIEYCVGLKLLLKEQRESSIFNSYDIPKGHLRKAYKECLETGQNIRAFLPWKESLSLGTYFEILIEKIHCLTMITWEQSFVS